MKKICEKRKFLFYKDGKIFFNKKTERNFFFILTIIMLVVGIAFKLGFL